MKITHSLAHVFLLVVGGMQLTAQDCTKLFPQEEGSVMKYVHYDKKDKVTGSHEVTVKDKKQTGGDMSVVLASRFFDEKGEEIYTNEVNLDCTAGVLHYNAASLLDPATMGSYDNMDLEITGDNLELPLNSSAGTALKDGGVTAVVSSDGMKIMTISINLSNRKIAAREAIETPAGSFDCVKYTYDAISKVGFITVTTNGVEWYSPDYGSIRSESYNKSGKLVSYTVLESVD